MTRRRLTPEERALWQKVADQTEKLHRGRPGTSPQQAAPKPKPLKSAAPRIPQFDLGSRAASSPPAHSFAPPLAEELSSAPLRMDRRRFARMKRGKMAPEARIDLHGMTLDRAHPVLIRFILGAQASGKRLVLVITGKGRQDRQDSVIPAPHGVLRHQVPRWLAAPPLAQAVLQITAAHQSHGGHGAYYVYLRRS